MSAKAEKLQRDINSKVKRLVDLEVNLLQYKPASVDAAKTSENERPSEVASFEPHADNPSFEQRGEDVVPQQPTEEAHNRAFIVLDEPKYDDEVETDSHRDFYKHTLEIEETSEKLQKLENEATLLIKTRLEASAAIIRLCKKDIAMEQRNIECFEEELIASKRQVELLTERMIKHQKFHQNDVRLFFFRYCIYLYYVYRLNGKKETEIETKKSNKMVPMKITMMMIVLLWVQKQNAYKSWTHQLSVANSKNKISDFSKF